MPKKGGRARSAGGATEAASLLGAIWKDDVESVRSLLAAGVSVDTRIGDSGTALIEAARHDSRKVARLLVGAGADVDAFNKDGETALWWAAARGNTALAQAILEAPGDALTRQRRLIEGAERTFDQPPAVIEAAQAFVDAAVRGEDLTPHVPVLFLAWEKPCSPKVSNLVARPLALHALRRGDVAQVKRLIAAGGRAQDDFWLRVAFAFADAQGADLAPVLDLVIALVPGSGQGPFKPLDDVIRHHPEQLPAVARAIESQAPALFPRLMGYLLSEGWQGDASPAVPVLVGLLSRKGEPKSASARVLEALVRDRDVDPSPALPELKAALAEGREAFHTALLLAQHALRREPVDWRAVDVLCGHSSAETRRGALQALAWAWLRGRDAAAITIRLAAGLDDASEPVRRQAAEGLRESQRRQARLGDVESTLLARVIRAVQVPDTAEGAASFLLDYVVTDAGRAAVVVSLVPSTPPSAEERLAEVVRVCRAVIDGSHAAPCAVCRGLADRESWGEFLSEDREPPAPPEFERLEPVGEPPGNYYMRNGYELPYRCPSCRTWYRYSLDGWEFYGTSTHWTHYLERLSPSEGALWSAEPWALAHDYVKAADLEGLDLSLLHHPETAVRIGTLRALEGRVENGLDVAPLEPTLRAFLAGSADLKAAGARLLSRHLLRRGRSAEVGSLLEDREREVSAGALDAVWQGATVGGASADVSPCLGPARALLDDPDERVRGEVRAILATAGMARAEIAATVAAATRCLDSERPDVRCDAAALLAGAAGKGADISAAVSRLESLQREKGAGRYAREALRSAGHRGPDPAALVPTLVGQLRAGEDELAAIHSLRELQEKGADISPAFEALAGAAATQSWALELMKRAVERGDDIGPAILALQHIVSDGLERETVGDYPGWAVAEVLAHHFARTRDWSRLEALLRSPKSSFAEAALKAVRWAVVSEKAGTEALLFVGRMQAPDAAGDVPAAAPLRTSWSKDRDHMEVNEREVVGWTEDGRGGIGASCALQAFLDDRARQVGVFDTFGPRVLFEVVEAVKAELARRKKPSRRRPRTPRKRP